MPEAGRWVEIVAAPYREPAVFCIVTGVRLQRRYWETDGGQAPYASPEAVALDERVARLRERWPEPRRPDTSESPA